MTGKSPYEVIGEIFEQMRNSDAPLNQRLRAFAEAVQVGSPQFTPLVDGLISRLSVAGCGKDAPDIGDPMPNFLLPDATNRLVGLSEILARGPAVVSFYRGHWCPYCRLAATTYAGLEATVGAAHMVAITPELRRLNGVFSEQTGIAYPILTDIDCGYALSLNLAFWLDEAFTAMMRSIGRDLGSYHAGAGWVLPIPATFVVDSHGVVVRRHVDPDYRQRMEVEDLLEAFRAAT
ncbi:MAG: AhpC/TSA family protein [Asticcacaulis sp.]|nr:AhpC/TSA family protein [Asticcacaulis sp.]